MALEASHSLNPLLTHHFKHLTAWNYIQVDFTDDDIIRIGLELANGLMSYEQLFNMIVSRVC